MDIDLVCWCINQENTNNIYDKLKICTCCLKRLINNYKDMLKYYLSPRIT